MKTYTIYSINYHTGKTEDMVDIDNNVIEARRELGELNSSSFREFCIKKLGYNNWSNPSFKNKGINKLRKVYNNAELDKLDWPVYRMRVDE